MKSLDPIFEQAKKLNFVFHTQGRLVAHLPDGKRIVITECRKGWDLVGYVVRAYQKGRTKTLCSTYMGSLWDAVEIMLDFLCEISQAEEQTPVQIQYRPQSTDGAFKEKTKRRVSI